MKASVLLILALFLIVFSCSKRDGEFDGTSKWKEVEHYASVGSGEVVWKKTESGKAEIIQFKSDNVFFSSQHQQFNRYKFEPAQQGADFSRLKVYQSGGSDTTTWPINQVSERKLELAYFCIEGCGKKFVRVSESN